MSRWDECSRTEGTKKDQSGLVVTAQTISQNAYYVDNNSTPTIVSNLLEIKRFLFSTTSLRHTLPRARLLCATIVHTASCNARQSWLSATIPPPNPRRLCRPQRRATPKRVLRPAA